MFIGFFKVTLYDPLYNGLVFLVSVVPFADVGIAVIILTVLVKLVLFPLSIKMVKTQLAVRELEPELKKIKAKHKEDQPEQARQTMALYKERGVNPFSGFLLLLIQFPIIISLYFVFLNGGFPEIDTELLYSFIKIPQSINMDFLGLINVGEKSLILGLLAGITQYFQLKLSLPPMKPRENGSTPSFKEDMARSFNIQMRYIMPVVVFVIAYVISAGVALYWTTSNIFAIGQEIYVRKNIKNKSKNMVQTGSQTPQ